MGGDSVFLTGGTGFLGGEILRQLGAAGFHTRLLTRRAGAAEVLSNVEVVRGDLSDAGWLAGQMTGCRAVFHCAAMVASWARHKGEFYRTNLDGFLRVLEACRRSAVETLVYTSSFFALGPAQPPGASEDALFPPLGRHPYANSKLLARKAAREARAEGFPIVILYPGVIYGPGPRTQGNLVARLLAEFVAGRMPGLLGDGSQVWSYSHVEDVARGHLLAWERAPRGGEFVLGGDNVSLREFFALAARLTGKTAPRLKLPPWLGMLAGAAEFLLARLRGRAPNATPGSVRMMYESWACDSSRAQNEIGYRIRPLEQGLRQTLRFLDIKTLDSVSAGLL